MVNFNKTVILKNRIPQKMNRLKITAGFDRQTLQHANLFNLNEDSVPKSILKVNNNIPRKHRVQFSENNRVFHLDKNHIHGVGHIPMKKKFLTKNAVKNRFN